LKFYLIFASEVSENQSSVQLSFSIVSLNVKLNIWGILLCDVDSWWDVWFFHCLAGAVQSVKSHGNFREGEFSSS